MHRQIVEADGCSRLSCPRMGLLVGVVTAASALLQTFALRQRIIVARRAERDGIDSLGSIRFVLQSDPTSERFSRDFTLALTLCIAEPGAMQRERGGVDLSPRATRATRLLTRHTTAVDCGERNRSQPARHADPIAHTACDWFLGCFCVAARVAPVRCAVEIRQRCFRSAV